MISRKVVAAVLFSAPVLAISQDSTSPSGTVTSILGGFLKSVQEAASSAGSKGSSAINGNSAELWMDKEFNPPEIGESMHLRVGLSSVVKNYGLNNDARLGLPRPGPETCDWNYLFHAKAGSKMSEKELQECALLEYHIKARATGINRDISDSFAVRDIIQEWTPFITSRIESMRNRTRFYFRPTVFNVYPYDPARSGFDVDVFFVTEPNQHQFVFAPQAFVSTNQSSSNVSIKTPFSANESVARRLEKSRSSSLIDKSTPIVFFNLDKAYIAPGPFDRPFENRRILKISNIGWNFEYIDEVGTRRAASVSY